MQVSSASKSTSSAEASAEPKVFFGSLSFLLMSSQSEKKVSYVVLEDSEPTHDTALPLIDSGLAKPGGLAINGEGNGFFVTDSGLKRILHYNVEMLDCRSIFTAPDPRCEYRSGDKSNRTLVTTGDQKVIVSGVESDWVAVDRAGALFFTNTETKSVSKVPAETVKHLIAGTMDASELTTLTQDDVNSLVVAETSAEHGSEAHLRLQSTGEQKRANSIAQIFQGGTSANAAAPAGVAIDDDSVYWTNMAEGTTKGSVATGLAGPLELESLPGDGAQAASVLDSRIVAKNTAAAFGVVVANDKVVYTDAHVVYGIVKRGGAVVPLQEGMSAPRGLAWDGDNTMFVADQGASVIYSFACGRLVPGLQFNHVIDFKGPFGLAVLLHSNNEEADGFVKSGAWSRSFFRSFGVTFAAVAVAVM